MNRKRTLRSFINHQRKMIDAMAELIAETHQECPETAYENEFYRFDKETHLRVRPDYCSIRGSYGLDSGDYDTVCDGDVAECWKKFISGRVK